MAEANGRKKDDTQTVVVRLPNGRFARVDASLVGKDGKLIDPDQAGAGKKSQTSEKANSGKKTSSQDNTDPGSKAQTKESEGEMLLVRLPNGRFARKNSPEAKELTAKAGTAAPEKKTPVDYPTVVRLPNGQFARINNAAGVAAKKTESGERKSGTEKPEDTKKAGDSRKKENGKGQGSKKAAVPVVSVLVRLPNGKFARKEHAGEGDTPVVISQSRLPNGRFASKKDTPEPEDEKVQTVQRRLPNGRFAPRGSKEGVEIETAVKRLPNGRFASTRKTEDAGARDKSVKKDKDRTEQTGRLAAASKKADASAAFTEKNDQAKASEKTAQQKTSDKKKPGDEIDDFFDHGEPATAEERAELLRSLSREDDLTDEVVVTDFDETEDVGEMDEDVQNRFRQKMKDIVTIAKKKKNVLDYSEISDFFMDMSLTDEQLDNVMEVLESSGIDVMRMADEETVIDDDEEVNLTEEDEVDMENIDLSVPEGISIEDPVRMYLKEIGKVALLTADQEIALAQSMEYGIVADRLLAGVPEDKAVTKPEEQEVFEKLRKKNKKELQRYSYEGNEAKKKLAESNLRLVVSIAKRYVGRGMLFLDLIQEGNLGLIKAVEKFDFRKGFKFSTYATWWIRQAITRAIADQARTIRIPVHMVETINKLIRVSRQLLQELGREPTPEEIAREMDMPEDRVREILKISQEPVSLETPIGEEEDSHLGDFIEDHNVPVPADAASFTLLKEQLVEVLGTLTDREQKVLRLRFGLDDGRARTLEEVGREFNVTRERIRQIEAKALRKLRHPSRSRKLKDYLD